MPRHEPETITLKRKQLAKEIADVLHGTMADEAMLVLGFIAGRIIITARPEARALLNEMLGIGIRAAAE